MTRAAKLKMSGSLVNKHANNGFMQLYTAGCFLESRSMALPIGLRAFNTAFNQAVISMFRPASEPVASALARPPCLARRGTACSLDMAGNDLRRISNHISPNVALALILFFFCCLLVWLMKCVVIVYSSAGLCGWVLYSRC